MAKHKQQYTEDNIQTLVFPDVVRQNLGMYIGGNDEHGRFVILRECLDNALDEFLAGRNKAIAVSIEPDGSFKVQDWGNGVPQGYREQEVMLNGKAVKSKMPTMQAVFGVLHTSGKFKSDAYKVSVGSHGVGTKGTNAASEFFKVTTCYKDKWVSVGFEKGVLKSPVGPSKPPKGVTGKTMTEGTLIHFRPDPTLFAAKSFPVSMLTSWCEVQSYLNPGLTIYVINKGKPTKFRSDAGPMEYITEKLAKGAEFFGDPFQYRSELADVTIAFSNADGCNIAGHTNGLLNSSGGRHVDSTANALFKSLLKYKGTRQNFTAADFKDGLAGVVNAKLHKPSFSSQDKAKLTDDRLGAEFEKVLTEFADKFWSKNKSLAKLLCERSCQIANLKSKFKSSKAVITEITKAKKAGLSPKYTPAHKSVPVKDRILIIAEGDSAAGGLKQVRPPQYGILPIKGKIKNAIRSGDKVLISETVLSILVALGFDAKAEDPCKKLNYGKVLCFADADPDGRHINSLLLGLFARYMPVMFERGQIEVANMPEFYALTKDSIFAGPTLSSVQAKLAKAKVKAKVLHAKGWGEVDPEVLRILTFSDIAERITISKVSDNDRKVFFSLMGKSD